MRIVIFVPFSDLPALPAEAMAVVNRLSAAGNVVHLVQGDEATLAGMHRTLSSGPFDIAWFGTHSNAQGFLFSGGEVVPAAQIGQFLSVARISGVVLNSCFSIEHVDTLQRAANVDVVATIDPAGLNDTLGWATAVYLADGIASTGNLREACRLASANGMVQYRFIPSGAPHATGSSRTVENELRDIVTQLVNAIQGNSFSRTPGILEELRQLSFKFDAYMSQDAEWKSKMEARLTKLEQRPQIVISGQKILFAVITVVATALIIFYIIEKAAGP